MTSLATILIVSLFCLCAHGVGERCWPHSGGKGSCKGGEKCCTGRICGQNCTALACYRQYHCLEGEICCASENCSKPDACECTHNYECGAIKGSCCGKTCKSGSYRSCVGSPCFRGSECQPTGEICCGGYCRRSSDCLCSKNSECGDRSVCCGNRCKEHDRKACAGQSCSKNSDCHSEEHCCDGFCSKSSCSTKSSYLTESLSESNLAAIVMSVLVAVAVVVNFLKVLVDGIRRSGPFRRRLQPEPPAAMVTTLDMTEMGGPSTPQPTAYPPGQDAPPPYTPVAQGMPPEHESNAPPPPYYLYNSRQCQYMRITVEQ